MELDDLRRHWQRPEPVAPPPLPAIGLLERRQPADLIRRMRRNAWSEIGASVLFAGLPLLVLPAGVFALVYGGVMVVLLGILGVYYARQLRLLHQMGQADGSLRGHLHLLCAGLRQLLRFYYYLTLWTGPVTLALLLAYYVGHELARPAGPRWKLITIVTGVVLVLGAAFQVGIIYFTRWYVQRLYGRHLDRLEGQLRELDEQ